MTQFEISIKLTKNYDVASVKSQIFIFDKNQQIEITVRFKIKQKQLSWKKNEAAT